MQLALRVDVDTRLGLHEGVPRLLELFNRYAIRASFFVTFGPDRSGRALRRLIRPSFIAKMWRTNPFKLYGFKTLLAGTLLPSQPVGEGEPALLKDIVAEGHELGIHGYDHVRWQDGVEGMDENDFFMKLEGHIKYGLGPIDIDVKDLVWVSYIMLHSYNGRQVINHLRPRNQAFQNLTVKNRVPNVPELGIVQVLSDF